MKFCKDCEYILKPMGALYEPYPLSICSCGPTSKMNYVTGEYGYQNCKDINGNGLCIFFKEGKICKK
jgi:hypothetical protein